MMLTMDMKASFFDRQAVIKSVERVEHRTMSRSLAYIRTTARTRVLRRRKKASQPGSPPSVHSRDNVATLKNIWFAYDQRRSSGVVGPLKLNGSRSAYASPNGNTVPGLLEGGGTMTVTEESFKSENKYRPVRSSRRTDKRKKYRRRIINVRPRPFMQLALDREIQNGNVVSAWSNVVSS
jgi:hypothetical protein